MRMRGRLPRVQEERGATLAIVAVSMVVLLGLTALTVDFGSAFAKRRSVVNANDAGALAYAGFCAFGAGAGTDPSALSAANTAATGNASDAVMTTGYPVLKTGSTCDSTSPSNGGSVTVSYRGVAQRVFAPILGLSSTQTVAAAATATWGAPGAYAGVAPFELSPQGSDNCKLLPNVPIGTKCHFWLNNKSPGIGTNANWQTINLAQWNVPRTFSSCTNANASNLRSWIAGTAPLLSLNYPAATYVCAGNGAVDSVFNGNCQPGSLALICMVGKTLPFPVNCPQGNGINCPDPTGQVLKGGAPAYPLAPYLFDIVGFASMRINQVKKGNTGGGGAALCQKPVDSNAWCLELTYLGPSEAGGDPGGGQNFGLQTVGLSG